MSLDFYLEEVRPTEVYWANITHNLTDMATEAGIYEALWHPYLINAVYAADIIDILQRGVDDLKARPEHFKQFNAENGWGTYTHFLPFVEAALVACREHPQSTIRTCT